MLQGVLSLHAKETEVMIYNIPENEPLRTTAGHVLKEVDDFKYLGSWVESTEADIKIRETLAWRAHGWAAYGYVKCPEKSS